jgi:thiol:disulfide interchange protein
LLGLVIIATATWIYGRWHLPHLSPRTRRLSLLLAGLTLAGGLALGWPSQLKTSSPAASSSITENGLTWELWTPERVSQLRQAGKPVYIDFTAKWCYTCQVNKRVYKDPALQALIQEKKIVLIRADYTNQDPQITAALKQLDKATVPINVLYLPGQDQPILLPELLTVSNVSEAFQKL